MAWQMLQGDAREIPLRDESVHMVCTSPPYWGLRDYHIDKQIGLEASIECYTEQMLLVFAEVWRVLRPDGTLWLNLGDSYSTQAGHGYVPGGGSQGKRWKKDLNTTWQPNRFKQIGLKPKDLCGIPWRIAFALQAAGWWLRSDIIWEKPNPMPESVSDRPTKAHEYMFLLTKSERYYYDQDAIREPHAEQSLARAQCNRFGGKYRGLGTKTHSALKSGNGYGPDGDPSVICSPGGRNARSVWTINTESFPGSHFATMPTALAERCVKAGCPEGGTVFDPFSGAGTTLLVADRLSRHGIGLDLSFPYCQMAHARLSSEMPLFVPVEDTQRNTQGALW